MDDYTSDVRKPGVHSVWTKYLNSFLLRLE